MVVEKAAGFHHAPLMFLILVITTNALNSLFQFQELFVPGSSPYTKNTWLVLTMGLIYTHFNND